MIITLLHYSDLTPRPPLPKREGENGGTLVPLSGRRGDEGVRSHDGSVGNVNR